MSPPDMRIAYFDTFSGISGDMTIGAFLDLGMPLEALEAGIAPLGLDEVWLEKGSRVRSGIRATKFTVHVRGVNGDGTLYSPHPGQTRAPLHPHNASHSHRAYREIRELLDRASLPPRVRERAQRIFLRLATAEAKIHGGSVEDVGFHEVGALDAIVDIVGAALCLEHFGIEQIYVSALPLGRGLARSQHGSIPVPSPATIELLRGFPTRPEDGAAELVTPTGAAIVSALATPGAPPVLEPVAIGYGAGDMELDDRPNLLRVILADPRSSAASPSTTPVAGLLSDEMVVLEANIDDMNPEFFEAAIDSLLAAGARDVALVPLTMKKSRPGTLLQVIAPPAERERIAEIILRETSTIGVRFHAVSRLTLPRARRVVSTAFGSVDVKVVTLPDGSERVTPEYAQCQRIARERGVPVATVYREALRAAWQES